MFGSLATIETEISFAGALVGAVTREARVGEETTDVAAEVDPGVPKCYGGRCQ